jgi:lipopolysaccharide export system permease protein
MLTILDRYIIRKFLGTFFYSIVLLGIIIPVIFDLTEKVDDIVEKNIPLKELVFSYYLNFIPYFANLFTPLFLFISVVFFTSKMANRTEIVAILSSGISFRRFLRPYLFSSILIAMLSLVLNNFIIPGANENRLKFEYKFIRNNWTRNFNNLHREIEPNTFVYLESYISLSTTGYKFTLEKLNDHAMEYKLSADYIKWDSTKGKWKLENYVLRSFKKNKETIKRGTSIDTSFSFGPKELSYADDDVQMMNYKELKSFIAQEIKKGSEYTDYYIFEMHRRMANSLAVIVLAMIAVPMASRKVRGGIGMHIGIGIAIAFTYVLAMQVSTVFATIGGFNPAFSAWIPNIIYSVVALLLILKAPK